MNLTLLILDERASTEDIVSAYNDVNRRMREKYRSQGLTVLSNSSAMTGRESEISSRSSIRFLPDWQRSRTYQELLNKALMGQDIFIMVNVDNSWICKEAKREDYSIRSLGGEEITLDVLPYR